MWLAVYSPAPQLQFAEAPSPISAQLCKLFIVIQCQRNCLVILNLRIEMLKSDSEYKNAVKIFIGSRILIDFCFFQV